MTGGLPFNVYTKLYESVVFPVISYGAGIWEHKSYLCIDAVQNRTMRFFLGVEKYRPVAALAGEIGWEINLIKQWKYIGRHFVRISGTPLNRINKRIVYIMRSVCQVEVETNCKHIACLKVYLRPNHIALILCLYVTLQPSPSSAVESHHSESNGVDMRINLWGNVNVPFVMR